MILAQHLRNSSPWLSDFGRLFDTAFQRVSQGPRGLRILDNDKHWTLEADFPGTPKEALDLEIKDGALHLGIKSDNKATNSYRLPLGNHVDVTGIQAKLELGVLTVTLPKASAVTETHQIEIN